MQIIDKCIYERKSHGLILDFQFKRDMLIIHILELQDLGEIYTNTKDLEKYQVFDWKQKA